MKNTKRRKSHTKIDEAEEQVTDVGENLAQRMRNTPEVEEEEEGKLQLRLLNGSEILLLFLVYGCEVTCAFE